MKRLAILLTASMWFAIPSCSLLTSVISPAGLAGYLLGLTQ